MAPVSLDTIEHQLQEVIQDLYEISVQVYAYKGPETSEALQTKIKTLSADLRTLQSSVPAEDATTPGAQGTSGPSTSSMQPVEIPPEVIAYVDSGRNPDIYTREFVELVQNSNAELRARAEAFAHFRDVLATEIGTALPDLKGAVESVRERTGGMAEPAQALENGHD